LALELESENRSQLLLETMMGTLIGHTTAASFAYQLQSGQY
jgi:hypothetical protein